MKRTYITMTENFGLSKKNKIVVIGAGNVGQAIAYTLMVRRQANDIVIIDKDTDKAKSAAEDIAHGTGFFSQISVRTGDYRECADAFLIIITAGKVRAADQSRLELAKDNINIAREITAEIMNHCDNPLLLVVSNPVDIITAAVLDESGLSRGRVIGSGTSLDTARFRHLIGEALNLNVSDINAYVLGEHGDSQVHIWSDVHIAGIPLCEYEKQMQMPLDKELISRRTKKGGAEIIAGKGATFYGVAMAVSNIAEIILNDKQGIVPVSHMLSDKFGGWSGAVISMPCIVGSSGITKTIMIPMSDEEKEAMDRSAEIVLELQRL